MRKSLSRKCDRLVKLGGTSQNKVMGVMIAHDHALRFAQGRATHRKCDSISMGGGGALLQRKPPEDLSNDKSRLTCATAGLPSCASFNVEFQQ